MNKLGENKISGGAWDCAGKRLIILGGSNCQINAFKLAQKNGIETFLFDYLENPPAAAFAAHHIRVSTFDRAACLEAARKIKPDAVMTMGTDQPVYTAALIAERLGLPALINTQQALGVTNKAVMKKILTENGLPTLPYAIAGKNDLERGVLGGEVVIKPLDSQGQKGIFRTEGAEKAAAFFDKSISFSRCKKLMCEKYYPSNEVTVSAWVCGGKAEVLTVTDRVTISHPQHIGVCAAHRYPSVYAEGRAEEIRALTQKIATAFNIPAGPLYIQLLIGEKGIMVNELACRIGGAFEDVLIPAVTGFDILGAVMKGALYGAAEAFCGKAAGNYGSARVLLPFAKSGWLCRITPIEEILALPFVADAGYNFKEDDVLPPFENAGARLGHAVILAKDENEIKKSLEEFYRVFYAFDENGESMLLPPPEL